MLKEAFDDLLKETLNESQRYYGDRLVTLAVYGSVGRGTMRFDSDIDLLIVVRGLPNGQWSRAREFDAVEDALEPAFSGRETPWCRHHALGSLENAGRSRGRESSLSGHDEDARLLYDCDDFFAGRLGRLRERLRQLDSKRIWRGNMWYWDLKPDYKPGEVIEL